MTVQDAETDPDSQLLDRAFPAIAQVEASLADERETSRLAVLSTNLLDTLTNLGHAIAEESEEMDALNLIAPGMWAAEEFHSKIISWLLDPSAHHQQAGHLIAALLSATMAPPRLLDADWSAAQVSQEWENVVDGQRGYLDILILDREHQNLIAIENKTFSQEHSNPAHPLLPRPGRCLSRLCQTPHLPVPRRHLAQPGAGIKSTGNRPATPSFTTPSRKSLRPVSRSPTETLCFKSMRRPSGERSCPTPALIDEPRRIYLEHREALDRIFANKPNWIDETRPMLKEAVAKYPFWKLDLETAQFVRFRAADWDEFSR